MRQVAEDRQLFGSLADVLPPGEAPRLLLRWLATQPAGVRRSAAELGRAARERGDPTPEAVGVAGAFARAHPGAGVLELLAAVPDLPAAPTPTPPVPAHRRVRAPEPEDHDPDEEGDDEEVEPTPRGRRGKRRPRRTRSPHPGVVLLRREWTRDDGTRGVSWRAKWHDPDDGEREKRLTLDSPELGLTTHEARVVWAVKKAEHLRQRRADLKAGALAHTRKPLSEAVADYIAHSAATKRPATVEALRPPLARLLAFAERRGLTLTDEVRPHDLAAFRAELLAAKRTTSQGGEKRGARKATADRLSPTSQNSYLKAVKACLHHLRRTGYLPHVGSAERITEALGGVRVPREAPELLTPAQLRRLLRAAIAHDGERFTITREENAGPLGSARATAAAKARRAEEVAEEGAETPDLPSGSTPRYAPVAPLCVFLLLSGCRISEALALEWDQVDLEALDAAGAKVGAIRVRAEQSPRSGAARSIMLSVSPALRRLLTAMKLRAGGKGRLFSELSEARCKAALLRLEARGAPSFGWHALRRLCGSYLVCSPGIFGSASVFLAAKQLGHSVEVAERHYLGNVTGIPHNVTALEDALGVAKLVELVHRQAGGEAVELEAEEAEKPAAKAKARGRRARA